MNKDIPQTKEFGYKLDEKSNLQYYPSKEAAINRVKFILKDTSCYLIQGTTGFRIVNGHLLSSEDIALINKEMEFVRETEVPESISLGESGREEPNMSQI